MNSTNPGSRFPRRKFIHRLGLAAAFLSLRASSWGKGAPTQPIRFGVISDIHPDMLPDGLERVQSFVAAMEKARVDFIVQLGDFCWPAPGNLRYLDAWNAYRGPRYHVLGNHDMDEGYTREQTMAFCNMPGRYYTFSAGPLLGMVLDGNDPGGKAKGYHRFMGAEQLAWLEREITQSEKPVVLFIHQPFSANLDDYLENASEVRAVLEQAQRSRPGCIVAVFSGHLHLDATSVVEGIRYIQINSAAYWWLNNPAARRETYPKEVHKSYRYLTHVAAYRDPLWAMVTVDLTRRKLFLKGRRSAWVGPDPWKRGETTDRPRADLHPWIENRVLRLK